jgi:hypothetical protein
MIQLEASYHTGKIAPSYNASEDLRRSDMVAIASVAALTVGFVSTTSLLTAKFGYEDLDGNRVYFDRSTGAYFRIDDQGDCKYVPSDEIKIIPLNETAENVDVLAGISAVGVIGGFGGLTVAGTMYDDGN